MGQIFLLIELVLKLLKLWDGFGDYQESKRKSEAEERARNRDSAAKEVINAGSEDEFDKASDKLHDNSPKP